MAEYHRIANWCPAMRRRSSGTPGMGADPDQRGVTERLREVAQLASPLRVVFLGEQPEIVAGRIGVTLQNVTLQRTDELDRAFHGKVPSSCYRA